MTKVWTCPEDVIVDCAYTSADQGLENGLLPADLAVDFRADGTCLTDYGGMGHATAGAEVDTSFPEFGLDEQISGHPLSNAVNLFRRREDFETDVVAMDLESKTPDRAESSISSLRPRSSQRSAFFASALAHGACLCLVAFFPVLHVGGTTAGAGNVIMMQVVAHDDVIPQDESPASIDSAESAPLKARRDMRRKQQPLEPPRTVPDLDETGTGPGTVVMNENPEPPDRESEQEQIQAERSKELTDNRDGDAPQDSAASLPSTASAERRFIPAAGREGNIFDAMVLSAIRESIFFPKAAFNQRHHGEVVVAFAVTKDGSLTDLRIAKPCESSILNEAAVKIIERAAKKFPPIPKTVYKERLDYVVPILFKEKRGS